MIPFASGYHMVPLKLSAISILEANRLFSFPFVFLATTVLFLSLFTTSLLTSFTIEASEFFKRVVKHRVPNFAEKSHRIEAR